MQKFCCGGCGVKGGVLLTGYPGTQILIVVDIERKSSRTDGRSSSYRKTGVSRKYLELAASVFLIRRVVDNLLSVLSHQKNQEMGLRSPDMIIPRCHCFASLYWDVLVACISPLVLVTTQVTFCPIQSCDFFCDLRPTKISTLPNDAFEWYST